MSKKLTYTNRKGTLHYFREVTGKRGTQIVCSQKESAEDLSAIPQTHEIVESPNGQVFCCKKAKSDIAAEEMAYAKAVCPSMVASHIRIIVETKKKCLVIHSANTTDFSELAKFARSWYANPAGIEAVTERHLQYEPVLKLELSDKETRTFAAFRMCWVGEGGWMFLEERPLAPLLEKYVPHIGKESFYELL
jgi:hypothetical protein